MNSNKSAPKQEKAQYKLHNPSVKLTISTWNKDSHGLYDYESSTESYKSETVKIENTTVIYRDTNGNSVTNSAPRTLLLPKN